MENQRFGCSFYVLCIAEITGKATPEFGAGWDSGGEKKRGCERWSTFTDVVVEDRVASGVALVPRLLVCRHGEPDEA